MLPPQPGEIPRLIEQAKRLHAAGDLAGARTAYKRVLLAQPKAAAAWFQLGRVEAGLGARGAAEKALRKALSLAPKERAVWQALAQVLEGGAARKFAKEARRAGIPLGTEQEMQPIQALLAKGAYQEAESQALAAVKQAPEAFWPAYLLGQSRAAQGRWAAAAPPLKVACDRAPDHSAAHLAYGRCLARLGQSVKATAVLAPFATQHWEVRLELAQLAASILDYDAAARLLPDTVAPSKRLAQEAAILRADIEAHRGQTEAAFQALQGAALAGQPLVEAVRRVSHAFAEAGDHDAAQETLQRGLDQLPQAPELLTSLAQSLQSAGETAQAEAILTTVVAAHPQYGEAYRALAAGRKRRADDPLISQIVAQLRAPSLPRSARRSLHFAAAKIAADVGELDQVFLHLHRANGLTRDAYPYRFDDDLAEAKRLVADWEVLSTMGPRGPTDPVFFVTGLPRSGTTLVETILAAHPQVQAGGEMPFLSRALSPALETLRDGRLEPDRFAEAGARYLTAARRRTGGGPFFTDKAISTFSRIGHTLATLPGARILVLRRDPRDVGLSMYRNMFPEGAHRYTTDLAAMGRYIRLHDALVAFWAARCPDQVHIVDYEALTAAPEPQIRALVAFAGLNWDDACLAPERSTRRVETLSFTQVRAPIGQASVSGWRKFEADLAPLLDALDKTQIDLGAP